MFDGVCPQPGHSVDPVTALQTRPVGPPASAPRAPLLRRLGRWLLRRWRWLTSMRTAVVLLFLLALAAVPGSLFPQRSLTPSAVAQFFRENPDLAPVLDTLGMFDVFSSPWFSAVYLLLFVSLIGCLVPRCIEHLRALRATALGVSASGVTRGPFWNRMALTSGVDRRELAGRNSAVDWAAWRRTHQRHLGTAFAEPARAHPFPRFAPIRDRSCHGDGTRSRYCGSRRDPQHPLCEAPPALRRPEHEDPAPGIY